MLRPLLPAAIGPPFARYSHGVEVPAGHRLRLHVTSSSFPRLERNLNTGGQNYDETVGVIAINRVLHDKFLSSFVELPVLP